MNEITGRKAEGLSLANFMLYLYILCIILCIILNFIQNFMHNFENFAKIKFRDILLTGTVHRDRRLNRDCPGQTGTYGRSSHTGVQLQCTIQWIMHSWLRHKHALIVFFILFYLLRFAVVPRFIVLVLRLQ